MINFSGGEEKFVTREEFPLSKAQEVLKDEIIAVLGYGVQGPGQSLNMRDNGIRVIVGQRRNTSSWDKAVKGRRKRNSSKLQINLHVSPPSTTSCVPVIYLASSDARNKAA